MGETGGGGLPILIRSYLYIHGGGGGRGVPGVCVLSCVWVGGGLRGGDCISRFGKVRFDAKKTRSVGQCWVGWQGYHQKYTDHCCLLLFATNTDISFKVT